MSTSAAPSAGCAYCGLPIPPPHWSQSGDEAAERYCCFGCRFAAAVTKSRGEQGAATWTLTRLGLAIFFTMNVMVFTMALWSGDVYGPKDGGSATAALSGLFRYLCLLFALPVLLLLGGPLLENAWHNLRHGRMTTDLLLLSGVAASYLYSAVSVFRDNGPVYFEVGCMVLVLVTLGRWLEATGKLRTTAAIEALAKLLPNRARLLRDGHETEVPLGEVRAGDHLRVLAGERIPCDGRVVRHAATVDEQVLTGESAAVVKEPGDRVHGGTLNLDDELFIEATAAAGALARLIGLVREAQRSKGHYERLADRVAAWFLPAVVLIALGALVYHGSRQGLDAGILTALAVLLIACPCALGLATPMAVWAALGQAARARILFRGGEVLERLASVRAILLDKTGTLTTGTPAVATFAVADGTDRPEVLHAAARLASSSTHSYSIAINDFAHREQPAVGDPLSAVRTLPGRGLAARFSQSGADAYLGSPRLMEERDLACREPLASVVQKAVRCGQPLACIGWEGQVRGVFVLQEQLRPEAREAIAHLRDQVLHLAVLTGDHATRGVALGEELGVFVEAGLLPEYKVKAVERAQQAFGPVAVVGDGINDAPALAHGDVGIAMGCGADVSRDAAGVCLLGNDLLGLPGAIALARQTVRVIRQNLFWAFVYNTVGIGLACSGYLNPVLAALAMVLSSLLVVANSLRLTRSPLLALALPDQTTLPSAVLPEGNVA